MAKTFLLTYTLIAIILESQISSGIKLPPRLLKLNDHVSTTSSAIGLNSFAAKFFNVDTLQEETLSRVMNEIRILNSNLKYTFMEIAEKISDLPNVIQYLHENNNLIKHVSRTGEIFKLTVRKKKQIIDDGFQESPETLKLFKQAHDRLLEHSIIEIRRIFTEPATATLLTESYGTAVKKYATVCKTNMSQLQVLDHLLGLVRTVYSQYYHTKLMMLEITTSNGTNTEDEVNLIKTDIASDYHSIVLEFKKMMFGASKDFWKCDPLVGKDEPYYELRQFSTYFAENEPGRKCEKNTISRECRDTNPDSLCQITRPCPLEYLKCNRLRPINDTTYQFREGYQACLNKDKTAFTRYYKINPYARTTTNFECKVGTYTYVTYIRPEFNFCECLCHENRYFFDENEVVSNYADHKIVTGARLTVDGDTIRIKIQEAKILPNGVIDHNTFTWKTAQHIKRLNEHNNKHTLESVDLTEIKSLPSNQVIVGFKFLQSSKTKRVKLGILWANYDFRSGKVWISGKEPEVKTPDDASHEYKLQNQDVPTKADEEAKPVSNNDQYVSFTITGALEDGGQTTIPFIDTQKVETLRPMPLSGAGLYLKGQPGYGGFIGMKLFTYDIEPYVDATFHQ